jgi:hypothetical protein
MGIFDRLFGEKEESGYILKWMKANYAEFEKTSHSGLAHTLIVISRFNVHNQLGKDKNLNFDLVQIEAGTYLITFILKMLAKNKKMAEHEQLIKYWYDISSKTLMKPISEVTKQIDIRINDYNSLTSDIEGIENGIQKLKERIYSTSNESDDLMRDIKFNIYLKQWLSFAIETSCKGYDLNLSK